MISRALAILYFFLAFMFLYSMAYAQENHAQFHPHYQNWVSQGGKNCCDSRDCGEIPDSDERTSGGVLEVKVEGQWCPIQPHHYLKRGNVPNAATSHICVTPSNGTKGDPCDRLVCYQPRPGS